MISARLAKNLPFWQAFLSVPARQRRAFLRNLSMAHVKDTEEIFYNILHGNCAVDDTTLGKLRQHKNQCKQLGRRDVLLTTKKKILQSGNGVGLITLGLSVLPTIIELLRNETS